MKLDGAVALVTGASRGLGRALCIALAARGASLAVSARDRAALDALVAEIERRGGRARAYAFDLARYGESPELVRAAAADLGGLDLLVCNAATGTAGEIADLPLAALEENIDVNFLAPVALTQAFLQTAGGGRRRAVCFVLSGAAFRALPAFAAYSTGKAALASFADALRIELRESNVDVLSVFPGTMDTEFTARMPRVGGARVVAARRRQAPEAVAERVVRALERGDSRLSLWGPARLAYHLDHFAPGLVDRLLARLHRRQKTEG
jgi:short-subunit dehydrogenase